MEIVDSQPSVSSICQSCSIEIQNNYGCRLCQKVICQKCYSDRFRCCVNCVGHREKLKLRAKQLDSFNDGLWYSIYFFSAVYIFAQYIYPGNMRWQIRLFFVGAGILSFLWSYKLKRDIDKIDLELTKYKKIKKKKDKNSDK